MHCNVKDRTGQRFGRLVVLAYAASRQRRAYWLCQCDCGQTKVIWGSSLRRGRSTSCGCYQKEVTGQRNRQRIPKNKKPRGVASFNRLCRRYQKHAKDRGMVWNLSPDECRQLFQGPCFYCGLPPSTVHYSVSNARQQGDAYLANGIDRKDNTMGYLPHNVVPCCKTCNLAKRDMSIADFLAWVVRVSQHMLVPHEEPVPYGVLQEEVCTNLRYDGVVVPGVER